MRTCHAPLIAALFVLAACSKQAAPGTTPADQNTKTAAPSMEPSDPAGSQPAAREMTVDDAGKMANEFIDKLIEATDTGDDCAKLGANLKALTEDARQAAAAEKEFEKNPGNRQGFKDKYQAEIDRKMKEPISKIEKCMANPDVRAFIDVLAAE